MKTAGEPELADADIQVPEKHNQPMNMVLMLSNFNLNITLLVQADLVNGSNEIQSIDRDTLPNALCLPGDRIMTMLSFLL